MTLCKFDISFSDILIFLSLTIVSQTKLLFSIFVSIYSSFSVTVVLVVSSDVVDWCSGGWISGGALGQQVGAVVCGSRFHWRVLIWEGPARSSCV